MKLVVRNLLIISIIVIGLTGVILLVLFLKNKNVIDKNVIDKNVNDKWVLIDNNWGTTNLGIYQKGDKIKKVIDHQLSDYDRANLNKSIEIFNTNSHSNDHIISLFSYKELSPYKKQNSIKHIYPLELIIELCETDAAKYYMGAPQIDIIRFCMQRYLIILHVYKQFGIWNYDSKVENYAICNGKLKTIDADNVYLRKYYDHHPNNIEEYINWTLNFMFKPKTGYKDKYIKQYWDKMHSVPAPTQFKKVLNDYGFDYDEKLENQDSDKRAKAFYDKNGELSLDIISWACHAGLDQLQYESAPTDK